MQFESRGRPLADFLLAHHQATHGDSEMSHDHILSTSLSQSISLFFFNKFIYLFIYLVWLLWVFVAAHGLSLVAASRGYSQLRCTGFSLQGHLLLWSTGSRRTGFRSCGSRALERSLSSCGAQAQLLHDMWDLPGPGLEPMSPAWAGRFSTTAPPRKPQSISLKVSECVLVP